MKRTFYSAPPEKLKLLAYISLVRPILEYMPAKVGSTFRETGKNAE